MHIILYVLDALRADHLGCYGYERETSPHVDALARDGVVFDNCFTVSTWTRPVAASILTGAYPSVHQTRSRYDMFSTSLARLPEVLRASGFKTAAFSAMGNVGSEIGFGRGFDHNHDLFLDPAILSKRRRLDAAKEGLMHAPLEAIALPRAEDINDYLFPWLEAQRGADTFSFVWSIETHVPYTPPDEFRRFSSRSTRANEGERADIRSAGAADRQRLMNLYDDMIYYNDFCLGQIVGRLKALDIYDDALIVVVGDHGDAFFEHGFYTHGHAPYEELIHVPMIMKFPGARHAGRRVEDLVELIDIFPTIATVARVRPGTAGSSHVQGRDLVPAVAGEGDGSREYVFSETQSLEFHNHYLSARSLEWKYIERQRPKRDRRTLVSVVKHVVGRRMLVDIVRHPRHFLRSYFRGSNQHLFHLKTDPGETRNLAAERPDLVQQFRRVLDAWQQRNALLAQEVGGSPYSYEESEAMQRHLEELGYL
jgi:arylsulfatase A-like enzyme